MKRIFVIGLLLTGLLFSCNKDEGNKDTQLKDGQELNDKEVCLEMVYPITFIMPDGSTVSGNSREEIGTAIKGWHEANPGSQGKAVMQFPVNANFKSKPVTINSEQEMRRLRKVCAEEKRPCFTMIYPLTFTMPDGSEISGNDRREVGAAIRDWYIANPGFDERAVMQFPVEVKFKGEIKTVNNEQQMQRIKDACDKEGKPPCFFFIYPITYIMPDATSITINSKDDRVNKVLIRKWYTENPGVDEKPALQYPVDVKLKDGTLVTLNNDDDMQAIKEDCGQGGQP